MWPCLRGERSPPPGALLYFVNKCLSQGQPGLYTQRGQIMHAVLLGCHVGCGSAAKHWAGSDCNVTWEHKALAALRESASRTGQSGRPRERGGIGLQAGKN